MDIILASTSPYRRALLERLQLPFTCIAPGVDETAHPSEGPADLAGRLALAKARAGATLHPGALVVGSDQVAASDAGLLGKPGEFAVARQQLAACSGREVRFYTALALVAPGQELQDLVVTTVKFRALDDEEINNYLRQEAPYDCAGSFKVEGLGIALFEAIEGPDPTALEGLPLMALARLFREAGVDVLRP